MLKMGEALTLTLPTELDYADLERNISFLLGAPFEGDISAQADPQYEQFLADVWIGIVLTLMVLCCVCCMCSCLLYHKFQQWKRNVIEAREASTLEAVTVEAELPSYTIASGLPTYQEALEQLKKVKELTKSPGEVWVPRTPPPVSPLSVMNLFPLYKNPETAKPPS